MRVRKVLYQQPRREIYLLRELMEVPDRIPFVFLSHRDRKKRIFHFLHIISLMASLPCDRYLLSPDQTEQQPHC